MGSWTKPEMSPEMGSGLGKSRLKTGDAVTRVMTRARPWTRRFNIIVLEESVSSRMMVVPEDAWLSSRTASVLVGVSEDQCCVQNQCRWVVFQNHRVGPAIFMLYQLQSMTAAVVRCTLLTM